MLQLTVGKITALDHRGSLRDPQQKVLPNENIGYDRNVRENLRILRALGSRAVELVPA